MLEHCERFASGVGIDTDVRHLTLAERAKRECGAPNVEFRLLDLRALPSEFSEDEFDFALPHVSLHILGSEDYAA